MSNQEKMISHEQVFAPFDASPEYQKAIRRLRPYHDLVLQIIKRRSMLGMTQKELAEAANTFQSRISKIESADHDLRLSTLIEVAEALKTEVIISLVPYAENRYIPEDTEFISLGRMSITGGCPEADFMYTSSDATCVAWQESRS